MSPKHQCITLTLKHSEMGKDSHAESPLEIHRVSRCRRHRVYGGFTSDGRRVGGAQVRASTGSGGGTETRTARQDSLPNLPPLETTETLAMGDPFSQAGVSQPVPAPSREPADFAPPIRPMSSAKFPADLPPLPEPSNNEPTPAAFPSEYPLPIPAQPNRNPGVPPAEIPDFGVPGPPTESPNLEAFSGNPDPSDAGNPFPSPAPKLTPSNPTPSGIPEATLGNPFAAPSPSAAPNSAENPGFDPYEPRQPTPAPIPEPALERLPVVPLNTDPFPSAKADVSPELTVPVADAPPTKTPETTQPPR